MEMQLSIKYYGIVHLYLGAVSHFYLVTAVGQWLRRCATNRQVAGSILDGVIGIFH